MRKSIIFFLTIVFLALVQGSFLVNFFSDRSIPNLILIFIIYIVINAKFKKTGIFIILSAGIIVDILYYQPIGVNVISFFAVASLIGFFYKHFSAYNAYFRFLILAISISLGVILYELFVLLSLKIAGLIYGVIFSYSFSFDKFLLGKIFYSFIFYLIFYFIFKKSYFKKLFE